MSSIEYGPTREDQYLSQGIDYYKSTMSQLLYEQEPAAVSTFSFKNRGNEHLASYVNPGVLQTRLDILAERGWHNDELSYFAGLRLSSSQAVFTNEFLAHLKNSVLPVPSVTLDPQTNDLAITVCGEAALATFWETVVMAEVNEAYFEGYATNHGIDVMDLYDEGDSRLNDKITLLQANPDIKFADFGTRRHFSHRWQRHVVQRLQNECPDNFIGTSNIALAQTMKLKPIGTFAHELPMIYAGLADIRGQRLAESHNRLLQDWYDRYGQDLSIALTDTFTSDFFLDTFSADQAADWRGVRHDSGDAISFGKRLIQFYEAKGIDPTTKTIVFSDGLDMAAISHLQHLFSRRINTVFGWGTTLTNDLGLPALNIVMKATHVATPQGEADTIKLSDTAGKHTGPLSLIERYQHEFGTVPATSRY